MIETLLNLPQELQNMIDMFNVEHRPQMKRVLEEMMWKEFPQKTLEMWHTVYRETMNRIPQALSCDLCCKRMNFYRIRSGYCSDRCVYSDNDN
jgi:hypothetical protein